MKDGKQTDSYSSSSASEPENPGLIDQARAHYKRYADDARRRITESHKANADTKPTWQKLLTFTGIMLVVIAALILALGAFKWPDAPIRQTPGGFVGKTGLGHTREDYELFKLWEKSLLISFPLAFIVNVGAAVVVKRKRKKESLKL